MMKRVARWCSVSSWTSDSEVVDSIHTKIAVEFEQVIYYCGA